MPRRRLPSPNRNTLSARIAAKLRAERAARYYSQMELSNQIYQATGILISRRRISGLETTAVPDAIELAAISQTLKISINTFFED